MHNKNFIIAIIFLIIAAAFVLPVAPALVDLLLIFTLCLSTVTLFVCIKAEDISEVPGLSLMISSGAAVAAAVLIVSLKMNMANAYPGKLNSTVSNLLNPGSGHLFSVLILISVFTVLLSIKAGYSCTQANMIFKNEIAPLRKSSIQQRQYSKLINTSQAEKEENNLIRQKNFFEGMCAAGGAIFLAELFCILILIASIILIFARTSASFAKTSASIAAVLQLPILLYAAGCGHIVRKSFFSMSPEAEENADNRRRIKVFSRDLDEDFEKPSTANPHTGLSTKPLITTTAPQIEDADWVANDFAGWIHNTKNTQSPAGYETLTRQLEDLSGKITVMCGDNPAHLPVTIPVNIAMRLAKRGKQVLLVDTDRMRSAVAKVFDIENIQKNKTYPSCVRNLWISPCGVAVDFDLQRFDSVIIYAPTQQAARRILYTPQISESADFMIFAADFAPAPARLCEMVQTSGKNPLPPVKN
jgi:hypothetical protein